MAVESWAFPGSRVDEDDARADSAMKLAGKLVRRSFAGEFVLLENADRQHSRV